MLLRDFTLHALFDGEGQYLNTNGDMNEEQADLIYVFLFKKSPVDMCLADKCNFIRTKVYSIEREYARWVEANLNNEIKCWQAVNTKIDNLNQ